MPTRTVLTVTLAILALQQSAAQRPPREEEGDKVLEEVEEVEAPRPNVLRTGVTTNIQKPLRDPRERS